MKLAAKRRRPEQVAKPKRRHGLRLRRRAEKHQGDVLTQQRGEVLAAAQAYATQLATECSSYSLWVIRRQVWAALDSSLEAAAKEAVTLMGESFEGADFREAVIAAAEGRRAVFR